MKKTLLIFILTAIALTSIPAQQAAQAAAEITFNYTRLTGSASNQFAVWVEDAQGQHIKTLYTTRWTANGGYKTRPTSIPLWVKQSNLAGMTKEQVDAFSSATPKTSALSYTWDGTNIRGAAVPAGEYTLVLEATLRWENQVYYRAPIRLGQGAANAQVKVEYTTGERDTTAERAMIGDVKVRALR
ncbi:MAG: DUF2271 domain-containing protein [Treponema sp.]|nr:DUF2271 domain-containing protein [Treponema sp.]